MTSGRGRLFAAGGQFKICAWYTPGTNTWCMGENTLWSHMYGSLAYIDDKLMLLGGSYDRDTDAVEEYDIKADEWSVYSYKMPRRLYNHQALTLAL